MPATSASRRKSRQKRCPSFMKIARISHPTLDNRRYASVIGSGVLPFPAEYSLERQELQQTTTSLPLSEVKLFPPVEPSKIVCVGRNYREHAAELGNKMPDEPLLFLKAPSAIISSGEEIVLPSASQQVEHEGELGVVIGRIARKIASHEDPLSYVLGYTCVNDVTA